MSKGIIDLSEDLIRLEQEGFVLNEQNNYLYVHDVPYLTADKNIERGILVMPLDLAGLKTVKPSSHVAFFIGNVPHNISGQKINALIDATPPEETKAKNYLSAKADYSDFYVKVHQYVHLIADHAAEIDPTIKATTFRQVDTPSEDMIFAYRDTNSSRAGIGPISEKLKGYTIAIVGVGGTGSYLLDYISKTPVKEIHLFDGDFFYNNNAFRAPGAASLEIVSKEVKKTDYFKSVYSNMHNMVVSHPYFLKEENVDELATMDFVFVCMDSGEEKKTIVNYLENQNLPFIETGLGIQDIDGALKGQVKITASLQNQRDHTKNRISYEQGAEDLYEKNIQIAELNSLNAILAVMKWKKILGFYKDLDNEMFSCYVTYTNEIINDDLPN